MNPTAFTLIRRPLLLALLVAGVLTTGVATPILTRAASVVAGIAWLYLSNARG